MIFHRILSDSKSSRITRTLLSILADLNNLVVWMFSPPRVIPKSFRPFINPSVTVPRAPIPIGKTSLWCHNLFINSPARSWYLSFFLLSLNFTLWTAGKANSTILQVIFVVIIRSGSLAEIRWSVCMSNPILVVVVVVVVVKYLRQMDLFNNYSYLTWFNITELFTLNVIRNNNCSFWIIISYLKAYANKRLLLHRKKYFDRNT